MPRSIHTLDHDAESKANWLHSVIAHVGSRYQPSEVTVTTRKQTLGVAEFTFTDNDTNYRLVIEATDRPEWRGE